MILLLLILNLIATTFIGVLVMVTVASINTQFDALAAKVNDIPPVTPPVATQADLDAIAARIDTITTSVPS